jgi:hypothetical protein
MADTTIIDSLLSQLEKPYSIMMAEDGCSFQNQIDTINNKITLICETLKKHDRGLEELRAIKLPLTRKRRKTDIAGESSELQETIWFTTYTNFVMYLKEHKCIPEATHPLYTWYNKVYRDKLDGKLTQNQLCAFMYIGGLIEGLTLITPVMQLEQLTKLLDEPI